MLDIIDGGTQVTHVQLANEVEKFMSDAGSNDIFLGKIGEKSESFSKAAQKCKLEDDHLESCYEPVIQSGGAYNLKASAQSDETVLKAGIIISRLGARYKSYCSNVGRCLIISPTKKKEEVYKFLLEVQKEALAVIAPGKPITGVYTRVKEFIAEKKPELSKHLPKNVGFATGIAFRESSLALNDKANKSPVNFSAKMVFCLDLGFDKVTEDAEGADPFSVQIIDTVLVTDSEAENLTATAKSAFDDVSISWRTEDDDSKQDEEAEAKSKAAQSLLEAQNLQAGSRRGVKHGADASSNANPVQRQANQEQLKRKAEEEMKERMLNDTSTDVKLAKDPKCYRKNTEMDGAKAEELKIYVDRTHDAVVFPVCGMAVPFHISTIKTMSKSDEGEGVTILRVSFDIPPVKLTSVHTKRGDKLTYIKELSYRSNRGNDLASVWQKMKDMQKKFREMLRDEKEMKDYVEQAKLIYGKRSSSAIRLSDLVMRPGISAGKRKNITGTLEAHQNGFLFTNKKGEKFELLYKRIKHAFYQGPEDDLTILLHFRLDPPLMIQKKKYTDIQFYTEVGEAVTDLGKARGGYDGDEMEAEQRERRKKKQLKSQFKEFYRKVQDYTKKMHEEDDDIPALEFEQPERSLGFQGAPLMAGSENVLCAPTPSCLVNLAWRDKGAFVLTLEDIDRIHFERVDFMLKNFDLVVIYKDYKRTVDTIRSIPRNQLESIKEWLNECDIIFTESDKSIDWKKVLKHIVSDVEAFVQDGGWDFLEDKPATDDEGEYSDESEGFAPDESDLEESESEDESENSEESDYSDSDGEDDDDDESEESEADWDQMEKQAARDDRHNASKENERDRHEATASKHKRKRPTSSKSSGRPSSGKKSKSSSPKKKSRR